MRPTGRSLGDGDAQAITVAGGHRHFEGLRDGGEALAGGRDPGSAGGFQCGRGEAFTEFAQTILDTLVGIVDVRRHLALQDAHAIENLARLGKAFLHPIARLGH
ncbi:hypothetical protein D9M69_556350 [compost metagenome]